MDNRESLSIMMLKAKQRGHFVLKNLALRLSRAKPSGQQDNNVLMTRKTFNQDFKEFMELSIKTKAEQLVMGGYAVGSYPWSSPI